MQGEPAHLQRLSVEGGAQDTQHARAEACPAKHIYPSDCVGSDVWMAQQVRPTLPDPAYRTDRQQVVNVLRRKSAESIKAGGQSALHLTGRIYACSRNSCELSTRNCPCNPGWVHICDNTQQAKSLFSSKCYRLIIPSIGLECRSFPFGRSSAGFSLSKAQD